MVSRGKNIRDFFCNVTVGNKENLSLGRFLPFYGNFLLFLQKSVRKGFTITVLEGNRVPDPHFSLSDLGTTIVVDPGTGS